MPFLVAALAAAGAAMGVPGAGAKGSRAAETLYLDVQSTGGREPSVASRPLAAGIRYLVTVSGTVSIWPSGGWDREGGCGEPLLEPATPSPGRENGPVGLDAEMVFAMAARPAGFACEPGALPRHAAAVYQGGIDLNTGSGWRHVEPVGGEPAAPAAGHAYTYEVVGDGKPLRVRYGAKHDGDDYGVFTVRIRPAEPVPGLAKAAREPRSVLPAKRICTRRGVLVIRLRGLRGDRLRRATVLHLGLAETAERHGRQLWARVDLSRSKRRRVDVRVVARTASGRTLVSERRYRTCRGR